MYMNKGILVIHIQVLTFLGGDNDSYDCEILLDNYTGNTFR